MFRNIQILLLLFILALIVNATADVPQYINYQGRLTDASGNDVPDGSYQVTFSIHDSPAGGLIPAWEGSPQRVDVVDGLFSCQIGSIPYSVFTNNANRYLGITVGTDPELSPREQILMVPYACKAYEADMVRNIEDGLIYDAYINSNANIDPSKILDTAITAVGLNRHYDENQFHGYTLFYKGVNFTNLNNPDRSIIIGDSAMRVKNSCIRIGDDEIPSTYSPLTIERHHNSSNPRYGLISHPYNAGTGTVFGVWSRGERTSSAVTDNITYGVYGIAVNQYYNGQTRGVYGYGSGGIYAVGVYGTAANAGVVGYAAYFDGDVCIAGDLIGGKNKSRIDHPLDPEDKYLVQSYIESPDMKNVYDGNIMLDNNGEVVIQLPEYVSALNKDFRYQLTAIGSSGPNLYVAQKISDSYFIIAGGKPGMEVSWQITGIRKDPYAEQNPIEVEQEKPVHERGLYQHPESYGYGEEKFIHYEIIKNTQEDATAGGGE